MPLPEAPPAEHGATPRHELYFYYRAPEAHARSLQAAVATLQAGLTVAHPGLQARLLRRPSSEAGLHTWMEIYRLPPEAEPEALAAAIEAAAKGLQRWTAGPRHVEHFVACAS